MRKHSSTTPAVFAGKSGEQDGPNISRLALHLQQEWDHESNAHLGSIIIVPQSNKKVWWRSGLCKTGQLHKWQARVNNRSRVNGTSCPYEIGRAVCPCNDLAHNHPKTAKEWDWEATGERALETVTASSDTKAAWRSDCCGHRWSTHVHLINGSGCPRCAREAGRSKPSQPSISNGASHLLAEWDWKPMRSVAGTQTTSLWARTRRCTGSRGTSASWARCTDGRHHHVVVLERSLARPSPQARLCVLATAWLCSAQRQQTFDCDTKGGLTPSDLAVQSNKVMAWMVPEGKQWHQKVGEVVRLVRKHNASDLK